MEGLSFDALEPPRARSPARSHARVTIDPLAPELVRMDVSYGVLACHLRSDRRRL